MDQSPQMTTSCLSEWYDTCTMKPPDINQLNKLSRRTYHQWFAVQCVLTDLSEP